MSTTANKPRFFQRLRKRFNAESGYVDDGVFSLISLLIGLGVIIFLFSFPSGQSETKAVEGAEDIVAEEKSMFELITSPDFFGSVDEDPVETAPEPESEPEPIVPAGPVEIPWDTITVVGIVVAILAGLAIAVAVTYFTVRAVRRDKATQRAKLAAIEQKKQENRDTWETYFTQHEEVLSKWGSYELDIEKLIQYPLFGQLSHPKIAAFHRAMDAAYRLRPEKADEDNSAHDSEYAKKVGELAQAFMLAESAATKLAWRGLPADIKKRLKTALKMLKIAKNTGASPHERDTAYKRVIAETEGFIVLPQKATALLEEKIRLALPAGPSASASTAASTAVTGVTANQESRNKEPILL